jgi:modification methylase
MAEESVDLVVTSPPYPMIQMWDELFTQLAPDVHDFLAGQNGDQAFETMHAELDKVWNVLSRVIKKGGLACINIGDAVRTIGGNFQLYANHARIITAFKKLGFDSLPVILWRKQTNAPNKFMGSGMLPAGAYVTLEHEYILIFRKGNKQEFKNESLRKKRMESAFFWEERNIWFSDVWDFKGVLQNLRQNESRARSAAFPFELAFRLINMYSLAGETVLDPFLGTGTTAHACLSSCRNSIGIEMDGSFLPPIFADASDLQDRANNKQQERIRHHILFMQEYIKKKGETKHLNIHHGFPVVTRQETELLLREVKHIERPDRYTLTGCHEKINCG